MKYVFRITMLIISIGFQAKAQEDFSWWNSVHHWDGHTSWVQYMTMSPSFLGPNALPVPEMKNGVIPDEAELELRAGYQTSSGDKTQDFFTRAFLPIGNSKTALEMYVVPLEFYKMDSTTRDSRAARTQSEKGSAGGDIYFSTHVQVIKNKKSWPDILLEIAFRTASGTNLRNARYTDGSGYFFDLSFGKNYSTGKKNIAVIRPYFTAGFYSYQTYDLQHPQNDAFLFGAGLDLTWKKLLLSQQFSGYSGYLNNGDKPMVYRCNLRWKRKHLDWRISYQWGLHDFSYQTFRVGIIYHLLIKT